MAIDINAKCIVVSTLSGMTARMVSRFRCPIDIVGITTQEKVYRKLNLSWGVTPSMGKQCETTDSMYEDALNIATKVMKLESGDNVVLTGGLVNGLSGNTNTIKVESVK